MSALDNIKKYFSGLASKSGTPLLGIEIGVGAIKIAIVKSSEVEKFIHVPLADGVLMEDEIHKPDKFIEALQFAKDQLKIKGNISCALGISGSFNLVKRMTVPTGSKSEIEDNVTWEVEQFLPFNVDDAQISFHIVGDIDRYNKDVLVVASKISYIRSMQDMLVQAGFIPKVVELKTLSLCNVFMDSVASEHRRLLIDFGSNSTKIILMDEKAPLLVKEISLAGNSLTEEIQQEQGLSFFEADNLKTSWKKIGNVPGEINSIFDNHIDLLIDEMRKVLNFYLAASDQDKITKVYITGGHAQLPGLIPRLSQLFRQEIILFNPLDKVRIAKNVQTNVPVEDIASIGATSIGLAMRSL